MLSLENIINKQYMLGSQTINSKSIHIAFGIDSSFFIGTGVLISSILKHTPQNIIFHIFVDTINKKNLKNFEQLTQKYTNSNIYIYIINPEIFDNLPTFFTWSKAMYYRFIIPHICQKYTDKIIYLDSDILCLDDISNIYNIPLNNNIAAVVLDSPYMVPYAKKQFNFKGNSYFNSGFLFINIPAWIKNNISINALDLLNKPNTFKFYDQDVLNILLENKFIPIDKKYNTIYHLADMKESISNDTIFLHYSGSVKPWQAWGQYHHLTPLWLSYKTESPWTNEPIQHPSTYKQAKFMARMLFRNKKYSYSFIWYIKYALLKLFRK